MKAVGLAVLVVALALPASASAERMVSYRVTVEGEGTYAYDKTSPDDRLQHSARFTWRTEYPIVVFEGDKPHTQSAENADAVTTATLISGDSTRTTPHDAAHCTPTGVSAVNPGRFLPPSPIPDPLPTIGLRLLGGVFPDFEGCPDQAATQFAVTGTLVNDVHTFDAWFSIPREAIGMGRIIQILHEDLTGNRCPNNRWGGADCTLSYDATVTFDKFADFEEPAGPPAPRAPGGAATPGSPAAAAPAAAPARASARATAAKLAASAANATVRVSCPAGCSGTVTATLPSGRRAAAAKVPVLSRARFRVAAGATRRVVVRFSPTERRRIRRARGVTLRVRTVSEGTVRVQTLSLRHL